MDSLLKAPAKYVKKFGVFTFFKNYGIITMQIVKLLQYNNKEAFAYD